MNACRFLAIAGIACGVVFACGGSKTGPAPAADVVEDDDAAPEAEEAGESIDAVQPPQDPGSDPITEHCKNGVKDHDETDVDCGGSWCPGCGFRAICLISTDCASGWCDAQHLCGVASCIDGIRNGTESDIDCGGSCPPCSNGKACQAPEDCLSFGCVGGVCIKGNCQDGHKNNDETDTDCGGSCPRCGNGSHCQADGDCESSLCRNGTCDACMNAIECPGTDTSCHKRTCSIGKCGVYLAPEGTPDAVQVTGDCKAVVCDGQGGTKTIADGADKPDDKNACTEDLCAGDVPEHPPVADGTPVPAQDPGDCRRVLCDGTGGTRAETDVLDVPDDGTLCTLDLCEDGKPANPAVVAGTACSDKDGKVCDGAGKCVACNSGADCGSGVCQSSKCVPPSCADKVKNGDETGVDCGGSKCAGCGADEPCETGADCKDGVCESGTCESATCQDQTKNGQETGVDCGGSDCPGCPPGQACKSNADCASDHCIAAKCVACLSASECPVTGGECGTPTCEGYSCGFADAAFGTALKTQIPGDCRNVICDGKGGTARLVDDADVPVDGRQCTDDWCLDGVRANTPKAAGTPCDEDGGKVCDGAGRCVACLAGADCATGACQAGRCVPATCLDGEKTGGETDADCGGPCAGCVEGKACGGGTDCASGVCAAGICAATSCADKLANGAETGVDCGGSCPGCPVGGGCFIDADCASGHCLAGKCVECLLPADCLSGLCPDATCAPG